MSKDLLRPDNYGNLEEGLWEAAITASRLLELNSLCVLCRKPILDEDCPDVSDVDLLAIYEMPEEHPERITVNCSLGRVFVDILWIPIASMFDSATAASYKILPHLLLESEIIWMRSDSIKHLVNQVKLNTYDKKIWEKRISSQISFGNAALKEAARNLDFPPMTVFFLQTAHSYYLMALANYLKRSTMSLLSKPMTKLRRMATETGCDLEQLFKANLFLETKPSPSLKALKRIHDLVSTRCSAQKPRSVTGRTRGHYTYSISSLEFEYRESVIEDLIRNGDFMNANFCLRFWAYGLSRCPIVLEEARQGKKPSFYVPYRSFKESVEGTCPEIIDDMKVILGEEITQRKAEESIKGTTIFRQLIIDHIQNKGFHLD
jgi:hypothetical protein